MRISSMAKQKEIPCTCPPMHSGKGMLMFGLGIFIFGLIRYLGYDWSVALMGLGILAFLKGLIIKMKCCK